MSAIATAPAHDHHDDHGHHHKETFITKYIFSQDHKMIAKQYLITGTYYGDYRYRYVYAVPYATCLARTIILRI